MNHRIGQPELLKEINRSRAFEILKNTRILSRPELAQQTGLSRATIALLMEDLLHAGVAKHVGLGGSTGGRPPALLEFNPDAAYALGAAMRDHLWRITITNLDASVLHRLDVPILNHTPEAAVNALQEGINSILGEVDRRRVLPALGLGTPGLVDIHTGVIKSAVDIGWFEVPLQAMAEAQLGMKTFVANRSKVGALAEYWHRGKPNLHNLIYISLGTGVAAGIVHDGQLFIGANSTAGELGHVTILPDGPLCPCGNRGCLQQLISEPAIADRAHTRLRQGGDTLLWAMVGSYPERVSAEMVFQAAEQGDVLAHEIIQEIAGYLGIGIATLVQLFNPELIVLGGQIGQNSQVLLPFLLEEVRKRTIPHLLAAAQIVTSTLGPDASAIGAAVLVLQHASELIFAGKHERAGVNGG